MVIPAHPLALDARRRLDERRQRALTRYYLDAGAGGIAVGVHTTQFAIRHPKVGLYRPVLELATETISEWELRHDRTVLRVAGIIGRTPQALREARIARDLRFDVGLLSLGALPRATVPQLIAHCRRVGQVIPLMGFYLQPAVGGRVLSYDFWRRFVEIESVIAIKVAPFDRYATLDVMRALADAGRAGDIALYTGNDDNIVADLCSEYQGVRFSGGLLGHWAVWTSKAVRLFRETRGRRGMTPRLARLAAATTDANAAIFDAANGFRGCIPGIHEILRRQGLLRGRWCLDPREELSSGQALEIDRVIAAYPALRDDEFVASRLDDWLR
jgi:dihydrodipicolinate synthase/N-acetylneuraminate lyase